MYILDLTNQTFGRLTAIKRTDQKDKHGKCYLWECKCSCGNTCLVATDQLRSGGVKSCGCLQTESRKVDYTGKRYGRLVAIEPTEKHKRNCVVWRWQCDCGNIVEYPGNVVAYNDVRSCGCLAREAKAKHAIKMQDRRGSEDGTAACRLVGTKPNSNSSSGYRGVAWHKGTKKWAAHIGFKGKSYHLGYFSDPEEAHQVYLKAKKEMHEEYLKKLEEKEKD